MPEATFRVRFHDGQYEYGDLLPTREAVADALDFAFGGDSDLTITVEDISEENHATRITD
jgi:hypothetical protein